MVNNMKKSKKTMMMVINQLLNKMIKWNSWRSRGKYV